jgi:hypothetical protein
MKSAMKSLRKIKDLALVWKGLLVLAALAMWVSVPFLSSEVKAGSGVPILVRSAVLTAVGGGANPHGAATYEVYSDGQRELEVEIEDLNLAAGTVVTAFIDGSSVGQMTLGIDHRGRLRLRTQDGQTVPNVNDGSTADVRNGQSILVTGIFGGGGGPTPSPSPSGSPTGSPSPSPSPSGSPNAGDVFAGLTGPTLNGVLPRGFAEFELHSSRTELEVNVRQVNLPIGTVLTVVVDGANVGTMTLQSGGEGELRLRSDNGQTVPAVVVGSTISINNAGAAILTGTFAAFTGPTPTPNPSPSPALGRSFEAHLNGSRVTPPVTTTATGELKVTLNAAETEAVVFGEFHGLSSAQTAARIEALGGTVTTVFDLGVVGGINGNFAAATFAVTAAQVQQLSAGLWSAVIASATHPDGEIRGNFTPRSHQSDFDGDGRNDIAVFRPSTATWYSYGANGLQQEVVGNATDQIVPGDYDGDGRTDAAVYRSAASGSLWLIKRTSDGGMTTITWGSSEDIPVRGDFDGDGRSDAAVFRPSSGTWYVYRSNNTGPMIVNWGIAGDKPMAADMDGDGLDDLVVFRPGQGNWYWLRSSDGQVGIANWGVDGDVPVRGDFDGDGRSDLAIYRPAQGTCYVVRSSDSQVYIATFGVAGDIPVPGNYDSDNKTDLAVYRPSTGVWYVYRSTDAGYGIIQFGMANDVPVAGR